VTITLPTITNWKTTALGALAAVLGFLQAYMIHDWHTIIKDPTTLVMFVLALLGFAAKDSNVTGGTTGQPSTPSALVAANQAPNPQNPPVEVKK